MLGPLTLLARQENVVNSPASKGDGEGDSLTDEAGSAGMSFWIEW